MNAAAVGSYFKTLQTNIVAALEGFDGNRFVADAWERPEGGSGLVRVIEDGQFFERGGVNFSHVTGERLPASATAQRPSAEPFTCQIELPGSPTGTCPVIMWESFSPYVLAMPPAA